MGQQLDGSTSLVTKGRYGRVTVEVDTASPLVPDTDVVLEVVDAPIFWQRFEYERVHLFCARCGCLGHRLVDCWSS